MRKINIKAGNVEMTAELNDSKTADLIWDALPISNSGKTWGDEIYFEIPVSTGEENPQPNVPSGTIAYWPPGECFCIFFGQKPASAVNVVGKLLGNPEEFRKCKNGDRVTITSA